MLQRDFVSLLPKKVSIKSSSALICSVADPDPGSGFFLTPGSGKIKKSGFGSGMNNPDHISESIETFFFG
jgi:hypothetical protein